MVYLNNAGTSWPKPPDVQSWYNRFNGMLPDEWEKVYDESLTTVTHFFNLPKTGQFLFTSSCTAALAQAMSDFAWTPGDRLIMSNMEHHALSRWFHKLQQSEEVEGVVIPRSSSGPIDLDFLEKELKKGVKLVALSMASNVTGETFPYEEIVRMTHEYGGYCLLDGAQTAGILPIDIARIDPDIFVFAGHKGPHGPQGVGGLYIKDTVPMACPQAVCEIDLEKGKSSYFPSYCDVGSVNTMAVGALNIGIEWVLDQGLKSLVSKRQRLSQQLRNGLLEIAGIKILGLVDPMKCTGAVSIVSENFTPSQIGNALWGEYGIKASVGYQCAPMAHEAIGTAHTGTVRLSVGPATTEQEVDHVLSALENIVRKNS